MVSLIDDPIRLEELAALRLGARPNGRETAGSARHPVDRVCRRAASQVNRSK